MIFLFNKSIWDSPHPITCTYCVCSGCRLPPVNASFQLRNQKLWTLQVSGAFFGLSFSDWILYLFVAYNVLCNSGSQMGVGGPLGFRDTLPKFLCWHVVTFSIHVYYLSKTFILFSVRYLSIVWQFIPRDISDGAPCKCSILWGRPWKRTNWEPLLYKIGLDVLRVVQVFGRQQPNQTKCFSARSSLGNRVRWRHFPQR